jgi:DNA replication protein DnaC
MDIDFTTVNPQPVPEWHTITPAPLKAVRFTAEIHEAVMWGDMVCPRCDGKKGANCVEQWGDDAKNTRTLWHTCFCEELRWKQRQIEKILPPRYHRSMLWSLKPSERSRMSLEKQGKMIEYLKNHGNDGFFFFGPPGTSKTTFATALLRSAMEREWSTWFYKDGHPLMWNKSMFIRYINWDSLIQEYLDYQNHPNDAPTPSVTPRLIRETKDAGRRFVLCLEELDKSRLTEYKANKLFELLVAMDETGGQLILTTNHTAKESFQKWLYQTDNDAVNMAGEPAWRRISDNCKMIDCKAE